MLRGLPVLGPADVVLSEYKQFDEDVKKSILESVIKAIEIAADRSSGIPIEVLPLVAPIKGKRT